MNIFAIGDLHLSGNPPQKPMHLFGNHWFNHWDKIQSDWLTRVKEDDIVLIAGDTSWAMNLQEALEDLQEISALPGRKILVKGNHDYWWQSISKLRSTINNRLYFIQNDFMPINDYAICGSRGWTCPDDPNFQPQDEAIYHREITRVETSLAAAHCAGFTKKILLLHYPQLYAIDKPSGFSELFRQYNVTTCIFGHLHADSIKYAPTGMINGTACYLVACDALNFKLLPIIPEL